MLAVPTTLTGPRLQVASILVPRACGGSSTNTATDGTLPSGMVPTHSQVAQRDRPEPVRMGGCAVCAATSATSMSVAPIRRAALACMGSNGPSAFRSAFVSRNKGWPAVLGNSWIVAKLQWMSAPHGRCESRGQIEVHSEFALQLLAPNCYRVFSQAMKLFLQGLLQKTPRSEQSGLSTCTHQQA
jgi:hypothetical protein